MATFKRPPTWGEYLYPASFGMIPVVWGGSFLLPSELFAVGDIKMDITPHENIYFDNTPSIDVRFSNTPSETTYTGA